MHRVVLLLLTGCFIRPVPADRSGDGGNGDGPMPDARVCPALGDDFEDPTGMPCGTWGAVYSSEPLARTGGALHTTVSAGTSAGCLSSALDLRNGVWVEIDLSQSGSDLTIFYLQLGASFVEVDFDDNGTPTFQGKASAGILVTPSVTQAHSRATQKFWRFTRGASSSPALYPYGIDLSTSMDGTSYLPVINFSLGSEPLTAAPQFRVTGDSGSTTHPSTIFDNYNKPCP